MKKIKFRIVTVVGGDEKTEAIMCNSHEELEEKANQFPEHLDISNRIFAVIYNQGLKNLPDINYRGFDICDLECKFGIVKADDPIIEPEFHGFTNSEESALKYIDDYWYDQNKED